MFFKPNVEKLKSKKNVNGLIKAINYKKDPQIQIQAITALGELNATQAIEPIILLAYENSSNTQLQKCVEETIRQIGLEKSIEHIISLFVQEDGNLHDYCIKLLKQHGDETIEFLLKFVNDASLENQIGSMRALGIIGDSRAVDPIIEKVAYFKPDVKHVAATALGNIGDPRAVKPLLGVAYSNKKAQEALLKIGNDGLEDFIDALRSPLQSIAAKYLDKLGVPENPEEKVWYYVAKNDYQQAESLGTMAVKPLITKFSFNSDNKNVRDSVFKTLENIGLPAIEPTIRCLNDQNDKIREAASTLISNLDGWNRCLEIREPILDSLKIVLLGEYSNINDKKSAAKILDQLEDYDDPQVKAWIAVLNYDPAGSAALGNTVVGPLIYTLVNEDINTRRYAAATALGNVGDKRATTSLIAAIQDESSNIRQAVVTALGKIGDEKAVESLITALKDESIQGFAGAALVKLGSASVEKLLPLLNDKKIGGLSATILGKIGDEQAVEPLILTTMVSSPEIRQAAIDALGKIGDTRAVDPLIAIMNNNDVDWGSRLFSALALGKMGNQQAVKFLIWALEEENYREEAVKYLVKIGSPAVEELLTAFGQPNWSVAQYAAQALGEIGDERALETLINEIELGGDSRVKWASAEALGDLGNKKAVEPLIKALKSEHWTLRRSAAWALGELGDKRAIEALSECLDDSNPEVRQVAFNAHNRLN